MIIRGETRANSTNEQYERTHAGRNGWGRSVVGALYRRGTSQYRLAVFRRRRIRAAIDAYAVSYQQSVGLIVDVMAATDARDAGRIATALSSYQSAGRYQQPLEPLLLLRDPSCARPLFEAQLQLPREHRNWVGTASALMALLEEREMDPASVCEWVAAEVPSMAEDVVIGAAVMLLRWERPAEASELASRYCFDGDLWRLRIETLAAQEPDEKARCLERMRTAFARDGGMSSVNLLVAEMHCAASVEKRDKLLRHLVFDHRATPFDLPHVLNMPRRGAGPRRLYVARACGQDPQLPSWTWMLVVARDDVEATRWANVFVPSPTTLTVDELWLVDSTVSGLCLPWGPRLSQNHAADWTGLSGLRRLFETDNLYKSHLFSLKGTEHGIPELGPPESFTLPPLYEAMMDTGRFRREWRY